jgi:UDP:flavonoid glycosyltransferase YjiC (YdhE family)
MKIAIVTFGTHGDVQLFVALARGLQRVGHDVYIAAPSNFGAFVTQYGVPFRPFSVDTREIAQRPEIKRLVDSGKFSRFVRMRLLRRRHPVLDAVNLDAWNLTVDAEAMIFRAGAPPAAYSIARKRGIPSVEVMYVPLEPSAEMPAIAAGGRKPGGRIFNWTMGHLTYQAFWRMFAPSANRFRQEVLGMPPLPFRGPLREYARLGHPTFYAYSTILLPRPRDWRPDLHVVGYFFLDEPPGWQPSADLTAFLAKGAKPVFVGFGSMPTDHGAERLQVLLEALRRSGQRAVLQGGWGGLTGETALPQDVFPVGHTPYSWLFPRMAAAMHHGGAGTSSEALRAGIPSITLPHNFEQPYWAQRLHELGVSPKPIHVGRITTEGVTAAITAAVSDPIKRRAAEIGGKIRAEDGIGRAIQLFDEYVARFRSRALTAH